MTVAFDTHGLPENERIKMIGESLMEGPKSSADAPRTVLVCLILEGVASESV